MHISKLQIFAVLLLLSTSGCVWPVPHTSLRSPEVRGRVVDAVTHFPIESATVAIHAHPAIMARTDSAGAYRIRATHNLHLVTLLGICSTDIPEGKYYYADQVDVSHPGYQATQIRTQEYRDPQTTNGQSLVLRDIALVPTPKP